MPNGDGGIRCRLYGDDPIIGYKTFHVNDSNYIFLRKRPKSISRHGTTAADGLSENLY